MCNTRAIASQLPIHVYRELHEPLSGLRKRRRKNIHDSIAVGRKSRSRNTCNCCPPFVRWGFEHGMPVVVSDSVVVYPFRIKQRIFRSKPSNPFCGRKKLCNQVYIWYDVSTAMLKLNLRYHRVNNVCAERGSSSVTPHPSTQAGTLGYSCHGPQ